MCGVNLPAHIIRIKIVKMVISYQLAWVASLLVFLSSDRQAISQLKPSKMVAWCLFGTSVVLSTYFLLPLFHWLAAVLQILTIVMVSWISLALLAPYAKDVRSVLICGTLFFSFASLIGIS